MKITPRAPLLFRNAAVHNLVATRLLSRQTAGMNATRIVLEAIALGTCIEAVYNRMRVLLARHILYSRHDELYVDAVTVERDGQPPREVKLGSFKLSGLKGLTPADRGFTREPIFDPGDSRYAGVTLFAIS